MCTHTSTFPYLDGWTKTHNIKFWQECGGLEIFLLGWWDVGLNNSFWKLAAPQKLDIFSVCSSISTHEVLKCINMKTCTWMFTETFSIIIKSRRNLIFNHWWENIQNMVCLYNGILFDRYTEAKYWYGQALETSHTHTRRGAVRLSS